MEKYLKRLCDAILADRFNDENYRSSKTWHGTEIQTQPLFCSYGQIGYIVSVCGYEISYDREMKELTIDNEPYKDYLNCLYLESCDMLVNDCPCGDWEVENYTDAGGDMVICIGELTKEKLSEYLDNFDLNDEVVLWWSETTSKERKERGLPFGNIKEHYEDLEAWLQTMWTICRKMPY